MKSPTGMHYQDASSSSIQPSRGRASPTQLPVLQLIKRATLDFTCTVAPIFETNKMYQSGASCRRGARVKVDAGSLVR